MRAVIVAANKEQGRDPVVPLHVASKAAVARDVGC